MTSEPHSRRPNDDAAGALVDRSRAARLLGFVDVRLAAFGTRREFTEAREYDSVFVALGEAVDSHELERLRNEGGAWNEEAAVAEGLLV